ncbi:hypothetical protein K438DRAFT_1975572 [Mycena galopus ATCC 62051]|nr:hypothetical protein K438DRAFT_1975572 [Mycena galopus ATCC 62051]
MHAAFVASPRVLAILSTVPTLRSKSAPGMHHPHDAHAMHVGLPMRYDCLQRRSTVCSKSGTAAQRDPHHHQRTQHTLQLFPITHPTFDPSSRSATICSGDSLSPLDSLLAHTPVQSPAPPFPPSALRI